MDKYIPLIAHEGIMATMERTIRRMWIVAIVLILMLVGTNVAWLIYEAQFEGYTITAEQDGDGVNIVGNGDVDYGAKSDN